MKPVVFVTLGLPASGKTYFTERLAKERGIFFLNCDLLRLAMFENPTFKPYEHAIVFGAASFVIEQHAFQGKSIISNANYNARKSRQKIRKIAEQHGVAFRIIWVQTPLEVAAERIQSRQHEIPIEKMRNDPLEVLHKMAQNLQKPEPDEPVITIDGTVSYEQQLLQFYQQTSDLVLHD